MKLHELKYSEGARQERYRKGRGTASGNGKTAGKGQMGQNSRTGGGTRPGFEGGQNPIYRRISKRGFINESKTLFAIVNLASLNVFPDGTVVTPVLLKEHRLVRKEFDGGVNFRKRNCGT